MINFATIFKIIFQGLLKFDFESLREKRLQSI